MKLKKIIAPVLSACLLINGMTSLAFAKESDGEAETKISYEDISLRDEYEKHFVLENGTGLAVSYPTAAHYFYDGEWTDIDNRLFYKDGYYQNSNNKAFTFKISERNNGADTVNVSEDGNDISWGISVKTIDSTHEKVYNQNVRYTEYKDEDELTLDNIESELLFSNAFGVDDIDLKYTVRHGRISEDIVLNKKYWNLVNPVDFFDESINVYGRVYADDDANIT